MIRVERRTSIRARRCDGCGGPIPLGGVYLEHVMSPGHVDPETAEDLGTGTWEHLHECATCARRNGRGDDLGPLAPEQTAPLFGPDVRSGGPDDSLAIPSQVKMPWAEGAARDLYLKPGERS